MAGPAHLLLGEFLVREQLVNVPVVLKAPGREEVERRAPRPQPHHSAQRLPAAATRELTGCRPPPHCPPHTPWPGAITAADPVEHGIPTPSQQSQRPHPPARGWRLPSAPGPACFLLPGLRAPPPEHCSAACTWKGALAERSGPALPVCLPRAEAPQPPRPSPAAELDGLVEPLLVHGLLHLLCLKGTHSTDWGGGQEHTAAPVAGPVPHPPGSGHCSGQQSGGLAEAQRAPPDLGTRSSSAPGGPTRACLAPDPQLTPNLTRRGGGSHTRGSSESSVSVPTHCPLAAGSPDLWGRGQRPHTQPLRLSTLISRSPFQWRLVRPHPRSPHHLSVYPVAPASHCFSSLPFHAECSSLPGLHGGSMATSSGKPRGLSLAPTSPGARPTLRTRSHCPPPRGLQASDALWPAGGGQRAHTARTGGGDVRGACSVRHRDEVGRGACAGSLLGRLRILDGPVVLGGRGEPQRPPLGTSHRRPCTHHLHTLHEGQPHRLVPGKADHAGWRVGRGLQQRHHRLHAHLAALSGEQGV